MSCPFNHLVSNPSGDLRYWNPCFDTNFSIVVTLDFKLLAE